MSAGMRIACRLQRAWQAGRCCRGEKRSDTQIFWTNVPYLENVTTHNVAQGLGNHIREMIDDVKRE
jgi:hypothetical protein